MAEEVILVDADDNIIGFEEKLKAHQLGLLHRAFSVFVFDDNGNMLLQQRADSKYHSAGLWTNACCSHQRAGETSEDAVKRRLKEEMGIEGGNLKFIFSFTYKVLLENALTEHELDHIFILKWNGEPVPDKNEAKAWKWLPANDVLKDVEIQPEKYTFWFRQIVQRVVNVYFE